MRFLNTLFFSCGLLFTCPTIQAQTFKLSGNMLELPAPILFEKGTAKLLPSSTAALQHIKNYLAEKPYVSTLRIEGHAEKQALSEARAMAVCRWLLNEGVECSRLVVVGFGNSKPVAAGPFTDGSANARVVVMNAGLRGRNIGGMPLDGGGKIAGEPCE